MKNYTVYLYFSQSCILSNQNVLYNLGGGVFRGTRKVEKH